ncbi:MAG: hypothetical protein HY348_07440 [Nitrospira defluvii]|nr:hypothetical protein [Nitrospira defluvii]
MHQLSPAVVNTLATVAKVNTHESPQRVLQSIAAGVSRLSELFTRGGLNAGTAYLEDPLLRAGYLSYYVPVNLSKVQLLLDELQPVFPTVRTEEFRVLDLGGGPGTGALGTLDWCHSTSMPSPASLRMTVVDHSSQALRLCAELWQTYSKARGGQTIPPLQTIEHNLERSLPSRIRAVGKEKAYDLIIVQNLLSELFIGSSDPVSQRTALVETLLECLSAEGSVMLIEPALRSASRALHQVRDKLLVGQYCTVYSPCLHDAPCPALVKPDDWCHEERKWEIPASIAQVDREVGFIKDALKFSYVILRKDGETLVPRNADYHRVVSELRVMKGEKRVWLCDETGRPEIGRQDKERSISNAPFDDWHRGAIVRVSEIVRKDRKGRPAMVGRIASTGTAEIVRPA